MVKYGALVELGTDPHAALLWAPVLGRAAVAFWLLNLPYVRAQGLGSALVEYLPRRGAGAVLTLTAILAGIALGLPLMLWTAGVAWGLAVIMRRWLGGCTGDTLGAGIELLETAVRERAAVARLRAAGAVMIGP